MGVSYGQSRGRFERLKPIGSIGYALSTQDINFAHIDAIEESAKIVNDRLDTVEKKAIERLNKL